MGPGVGLIIVESHKHVGSYYSVSANVRNEINCRTNVMRVESQNLRKVLRKAALPLNRKVHTIQAYILSKGFFQSGSRPQLNAVEYKRVHSCIMKLYRDATQQYYRDGIDTSSLLSYSDIIYEYGLICLMTLLRFFSLSLFSRVVFKQPPYLMSLIRELSTSPNTWAYGLVNDLLWLNHGAFWGLVPLTSSDSFYNNIVENPLCFSRKVKAYCRNPFANLATETPVKPSLQNLGHNVECQICNRSFTSLQQLSLHMFKARQVRNQMRLFVDTTHCCVCLKEFRTRERCLNHVRYRSAVCRANLLLRGPLISESEASRIEESEKVHNASIARAGKRRHHVTEPAVQLSGPLLPVVSLTQVSGNHHPLGNGHSYLPG